MATGFNGLKALMEREDLLHVLLNKEKSFVNDFTALSNAKPEERGQFSFKSLVVEVLLCKSIEQSTDLSETMIQEIKKVCENNKTLRSKYPETFGPINEMPLRDLQSNGQIFDVSGGLRFYPSYQSVTIYTPKWTQVPNANEWTGEEDPLTNDQLSALENHIFLTYDSAQIVEPNTWRYNPAGWTWHKSETSEDVCIFYKSESVYVTDYSYVEVPQSIATKVVYGDYEHSATVVDSQWYISKWGDGGPLVRHHLTSLPDGTDNFFYSPNIPLPNYYPNSTKHFYMKQPTYSISGNGNIINSEVYYIPNLPSGYTVTWSLSDSHYNQYCLQQNNPSANQCTITKDWSNMVNATLTANISYQGYAITTATKIVSALNTFVGTYNYGNGTQQINYPYPIYVSVGSTVHIHSSNMIGATVLYRTQYTAIPSSWYFDSSTGYLCVGMPTNSNVPVIVDIDSNGTTYTLSIIPSPNLAMNISLTEETLNVELTHEEGRMEQTPNSTTTLWRLEVYDAVTGEKKCGVNVHECSYTLSTAGWKSGIYSVQAIIGDVKIYEKIVIK